MSGMSLRRTISILLAILILSTSFFAVSASADEAEVVEDTAVVPGSYVMINEGAVDAVSGEALHDWCYTTVMQLSEYAVDGNAVLTLCGNEVAVVDPTMLTVTEKALYSDITLGDSVKINKNADYDYNGKRVLFTDYMLKYTVTAIEGNRVEISNSTIEVFGFTYTHIKKMNVTDLVFIIAGDLPTDDILEDITVGSIVTIRKGAKDYSGDRLSDLCYYLTFKVVGIDGDKVTLNKDFSAIGITYTVKKVVNAQDLKLVSKGSLMIEKGSLVNIKNGACDYDGKKIHTAYTYFIFRVVSIEGDRVTIASDISFSSLSYTITKTVNIKDLVLTEGDVSFDPAIEFVLDEFNIDKSIIYGDVTGSGSVGMTDVVMLQQILAHISDFFDEEGRLCADVNGDGRIDMKDIVIIEQYLAGLITVYPVEISNMFV